MLSLSKHEEVHRILDGPTSPCLLARQRHCERSEATLGTDPNLM